VLSVKELSDIRRRVTGRRTVIVPAPPVWFIRDLVDGRHLASHGVKGRTTWEWLKERAA